jgi:predicted esterase
MTGMRSLLLPLALVGPLASSNARSPLHQDPPLAGEAAGEDAEERLVVTRRDLGELVQRVDELLAPWLCGLDADLAEEGGDSEARDRLRAANQRFDALSLQFFAGRLPDAYLALDRWARELERSAVGPDAAAPEETGSKDEELATALCRHRGARRPWTPLGARRAAIEAQLEEGKADERVAPATLRVLRARLELLVDEPSPARSREFVLSTPELADAVEREALAALAGEAPYQRTTGDLWRTVSNGKSDLRLRLYVPERRAEKVPLVVAFHGAGGDECFLFELAGDGFLKRLADEHGFAVACPLTSEFMGRPAAFDALLDELDTDLGIDRSRVFVVGHSMGAAATTSLCNARPDAIRRAVCIGGYGGTKEVAPPVLVLAGELDPLARPERLARAVERAVAAGGRVTMQELPNQGHTLLLPAAFRRAVAFFELDANTDEEPQRDNERRP